MANFCLPKISTENLLQAIKDSRIDPEELVNMTSAERRDFLSKIVGEENAKEVNALLESKIILKDQQRGMVTAIKKMTGISEATRTDLIAKIERMDKILNPAQADSFLEDLAAKKLGADVTLEETQKITALAREAEKARTNLKTDPTNYDKQVAFGNKYLDLIDYRESLKPQSTIWTLKNIATIPNSALTSILHFSASFVQGWGMITTRPFWEAFGKQFSYFADEQNYRDLQASILAHPDYEIAKAAHLGLTKLGDKLGSREEAIQSSILEHIPLLGKLVRASSRAFTGFLNYTRFHRFTDLIDAARLNGEDISVGSKASKDIAKTVNDFTGRGNLGKNDSLGLHPDAQAYLNSVFFSPRKISATINMFNPQRYLDPRISATARMGALRQLSGSLIATAAILQLASMAGAKVNWNPTATNFGKIQFGNTTVDITGSNSTYIRLLARLITGQSISSTGKSSTLNSGKFGATTKADDVYSFFRDKLAPAASVVSDFLYGADASGKKVTWSLGSAESEAYDKLTPLVMQDFINLAVNDPHNTPAWVASLLAVFGAQEQSEPSKK